MLEAQYKKILIFLFFVRPEFRQKKTAEQAEDSSPDPSSARASSDFFGEKDEWKKY